MFQTQLPWVSRDPCQLRFGPEMFSCEDLPAPCQHMLRSHSLLSSKPHTAGSLALSPGQSDRAGRLTSVPTGASEHSDAAQNWRILFPIPFPGSGCNSFALSYVRSQCHFLAPLLLSPAHPNPGAAAEAASILKESVSASPGTHLLWTAG